MEIETKKIKVSFSVGTKLSDAVTKCVEFCKEYKTEVALNFNGKTHTITRFTNDTKIIVDEWYK